MRIMETMMKDWDDDHANGAREDEDNGATPTENICRNMSCIGQNGVTLIMLFLIKLDFLRLTHFMSDFH